MERNALCVERRFIRVNLFVNLRSCYFTDRCPFEELWIDAAFISCSFFAGLP